jgi:hypothetical protein
MIVKGRHYFMLMSFGSCVKWPFNEILQRDPSGVYDLGGLELRLKKTLGTMEWEGNVSKTLLQDLK